MDIIVRLKDNEKFLDAIDDAIREIERLRKRVAELEAAQQGAQRTACLPNTSTTNVHLAMCGYCLFAADASR